jgi:hypothetical protein
MAETAPTPTPVQKVFQLAQLGSKAHGKLVIKLLKIRRDLHVAGEDFFSQFVQPVHQLLVVKHRHPAVERCVEFVWKFATACKKNDEDNEDEEDFACQLIRHLLKYNNAKDSAVRFRVCQLVAATFNNLDEEAEIEDDLWDLVVDVMIKRCQDKTVAVRAQATSCLRRLHEPEDMKNDATSTLVTLMNTDKAKEVRRVALSCLGISRYTLPHLLTRTRDEEPSVRRKALEILASFDRLLEVLSISQRVRLVEQCLLDRDATVAKVARDMLATKWLPKCGDEGYDVLELLSKFDVLGEEKVGLLVVNSLIQSAGESNANSKLLSAVQNAPVMKEVQYWQVKEAALLWRAQCEHAKSTNDHASLEDRLHMGSIMGFCDILKENLPTTDAPSTEDRDYVCRQMLLLAKMLEFGHDEAGRVELNRLLTASVEDKCTPESIVSLAIEVLMWTHCGNENDYLLSMTEIISNVTDDTEQEDDDDDEQDDNDDEMSRKKQKYIQGLITQVQEKRNEMTQCVRDENFALAQSIKNDIADLEDEIADMEDDFDVLGGKDWGLQRGLSIAEPMLRQTRQTLKQCPILEGLWSTLLMPACESEFPSVRTDVAKCIGLYSLLDPTGEQGVVCMPLLMRMATYDMFEVQVAAIQAMFDLIMIFPKLATFEYDGGDDDKCKNPITIMLSFLKNSNAMSKDDADDSEQEEDSEEIQQELTIKMTTIVAEGLARLMYNGRTRRTDVMEQLLLLFFGKSGAVSKMIDAWSSSSSTRTSSDPLFRVRQCLHLFFPQFAIHSLQNQHIIERSGYSAFRSMMSKSSGEEINDALIEEYVKFLGFYLQERDVPETPEDNNVRTNDALSFHGRLALNLLSEVLLSSSRRRNTSHIRSHHSALCKSVSKLNIPTWDVSGRVMVSYLCTVCIEGCDDYGKWSAIDKKNVTKPLKSFCGKMKKEESVALLGKENALAVCGTFMEQLQRKRDNSKKTQKNKETIASTDELDEAAMTSQLREEKALKSKKSKRKIKSKTTKASSFDLDNEFDDYSKRSSSGSTTSKTSSRRMSSPIATSRKRVTMSPPDANYENQTINSNKKISEISKAKKSIVVEDIPLAPSAPIVSSQPTKDQMLAEIDNLLSDDSDSD